VKGCQRRRRAGMTLVELVVAMTIATAAILSGYRAYAAISDRRLVAIARADAVARAFNTRALLASWLSNARLTIEEDEVVFRSVDDARRRGRDEPPEADIVFLTSAPSPVSRHGTIVHLFVARDSGVHGLTAELSEWRGRRSTTLQLDPSIGGLAIDFASVFGAQQRTASSWVSSTLLPATVRLRFFPRRSDTLALLLRLPLSIRLAASGSSGIEGGS